MSFVVAGVQTRGNGVNFGANLCGSLFERRNYFECMKHDTHCVFVFSLQLEFTQRFFFLIFYFFSGMQKTYREKQLVIRFLSENERLNCKGMG